MEIIKMINLGVAFFVELAMVAAFVYWGFNVHSTLLIHLLLGVGVPILLMAFWGIFLSPQANYPLPLTVKVTLKCVLFALGSLSLFVSNQKALGVVLFVTFVVNETLALLWHQEQ